MEKPKEMKIPVPWGYIAGKTWGSKEKFPVLVVHGLLDNAGSFNRLIAHLSKDYYYVAIDLPGHGLSSHFSKGLTIDYMNYVLAIRYVLIELKWKKFYYMAHSLGAEFGVIYNIIYPGSIEKFVLIDGFLPFINLSSKKLVEEIKRRFDLAIKIKNESLLSKEEVLHALKWNRMFCLNSEAAEEMFERAVSKVGNLYKYNRDVRVGKIAPPIFYDLNHIYNNLLNNINVDILLFLTPVYIDEGLENILEVFESFPKVKIIFIEGNHDVHNNNPEIVSKHINNFLKSKVSKL